MKRVLVTGGSGFIGRHLVRALVNKHLSVTSLGMRNKGDDEIEKIILNLAAYEPKKRSVSKGFDMIFHLAATVKVAEMIEKPKENILNNVLSTLNILEDIRLNNPNCIIVFASSDKIYGDPEKGRVKEEDISTPTDPYGSSKLISELLIQSYHKNYGINYIIIRSGNTFGPGQSEGLFIPSVMARIIKGQDTLRVGNLEPYRNFVYINDLIDAYVRVIDNESALNKIFNISAYNLQISAVLEEIKQTGSELTGKQVKVVEDKNLFRKCEKNARRFSLDCSKAEDMLGWNPKYSFSEALKNTFKSYLKRA